MSEIEVATALLLLIVVKNHKNNKKEKHNLWKLHTFFKFRLLRTAYIFKLELWTKISRIFNILKISSAANEELHILKIYEDLV